VHPIPPQLPELDISGTDYLWLGADLRQVINDYNSMVARIDSGAQPVASGLQTLAGILDALEQEIHTDLQSAAAHQAKHPGMGDELEQLRGFLARARLALTNAGYVG
jgi:hypothetical protein